MLKLLRHLLCLGILFGLAGNGVAVAAPCLLMKQDQVAASSAMPDCKMASACTDCAAKPDKSDTKGNGGSKTSRGSGCMLMAGCAAVLGVKAPHAPSTAQLTPVAEAFWPASTILAGRDTGPEPEPPTFLA
ncbi:hypothetical protein ACFQ1E_14150 [Sphingomonas canadensis]|uniref:DUF2946 domain-containing protein n=1 Tax=Sphingomonas canadensis TaxID=1219257 RepID=A0ABW3H8Y6_9SPHN|nr:hypothetical protein [Sphingomonas canadensis]MCW3837273.1 hypothetical protein [Sphingomonas canadensis]